MRSLTSTFACLIFLTAAGHGQEAGAKDSAQFRAIDKYIT
jgi:hypothetical protein